MRFLEKHWRGLLLITAGAAIVARWTMICLLSPAGVNEKIFLPRVFPNAYGYTDKSGTPPRYEAFTPGPDGESTLLGAIFRSSEVADVPRGYAGPVPVLVGVSRQGIISGVRLLEHNETPSYVAGVQDSEFLQQFVGRSITEPLRIGEDLDGVTRATVTATAVAAGVRISSRTVASAVLGIPVPVAGEESIQIPWLSLALLLLLICLAAFSILKKNRTARWLSLLLGLAFLGYWKGIYISSATAVNILLWRWPSVGEHLVWYVLVAVCLAAAVLWKNVYCARMCPFGALQEILHLVSVHTLSSVPDEERRARVLRYVFLWLVTMAVFLFGRTGAAGYEPFGTAFDFKGGGLRWIFLGVVLLLANLRHRFWCRYFCPTGIWLQLLGRMRSRNPFD